ncbi:MAG: hypothetical protein ABEJ64_02085 [Candidatus Nanohaloarchaea archaeon]
MKEAELEKNQLDLQFQNWVSVSNVLLGSGLTAVIAAWPVLDSFGLSFLEKVFLDLAVSGSLMMLGVLARNRAHDYRRKIPELGK